MASEKGESKTNKNNTFLFPNDAERRASVASDV